MIRSSNKNQRGAAGVLSFPRIPAVRTSLGEVGLAWTLMKHGETIEFAINAKPLSLCMWHGNTLPSHACVSQATDATDFQKLQIPEHHDD